MVRFLDNFPTSRPSLEEAGVMMQRIKSALLTEASSIKTQGKQSFNAATPLHLSIIRANEALLTDKSKPFYRPLLTNAPHEFIEHVCGHKIYEMQCII